MIDGARLCLYNGCGAAYDRGETTVIKTVEAIIDERGQVSLLEPVRLPAVRRALVTILEEEPLPGIAETAFLSEAALAEDWNRPEEDEAWSHLQSAW